MVLRLLMAAVLGALAGYQRERDDKNMASRPADDNCGTLEYVRRVRLQIEKKGFGKGRHLQADRGWHTHKMWLI